ncbi:sulfotransferase family protein [Rhodovulum adriaticum]|uniref:Sulfotransferase family protein n=1 Tax=Rhodovulum adriaticum TaxID=35804 RepID=A0A4R2NZN6_RHOAD|nr:sulfotransferase [Rhodovulum adriaticum]MBK1634221.1 hypothetical protein [Rhodovulum adriaticum]TCP27228.1 sulfotransferase family protein [Rhodovulum adriaticum]
MSGAPPNLFVVGAMKAGTTALHGYLDLHPEIFMCDPKEPGFFARADRSEAELAAYLALFAAGTEARYRGESSTQYTKAPGIAGVPDRLVRFAPGARILYMVREPVARIVSQYLFNMRIHGEDRPICQAVREDPRYRQIGDYHAQIAPYLARFGRNNLRILSAERLSADRQATMNEVFGWLGLDPVPVTRELRKNTAADGLRRYGRLTALLLRPELEPARRAIKRVGAEDLARRAWTRFNPPRPSPVTDTEIAELRALLAQDIATQQAALAPLMGAHPPDWSTPHG